MGGNGGCEAVETECEDATGARNLACNSSLGRALAADAAAFLARALAAAAAAFLGVIANSTKQELEAEEIDSGTNGRQRNFLHNKTIFVSPQILRL